MNNVFKKTFCRKLGLSKLLVECENVVVTIRSTEKDADFQSRRKIPVCYIPNLPMLKTVAEYILLIYVSNAVSTLIDLECSKLGSCDATKISILLILH
jgi:hypothetical protein